MEAVELLTPEKSLSMKEACIERARMFALDSFRRMKQNKNSLILGYFLISNLIAASFFTGSTLRFFPA
jgi:hypothetical protein